MDKRAVTRMIEQTWTDAAAAAKVASISTQAAGVGSHFARNLDGKIFVCHCGPANLYTGAQFVSLDDVEAVASWERR